MPEDEDIQQAGIQQAVVSRASTDEIRPRIWDTHSAVDPSIANDARKHLQHNHFDTPKSGGTGPYPFRILQKTDSADAVVKAWLEEKSNICRVRKKFDIHTQEPYSNLLSEWHPIVINSMPRPGTLRGIAPDKQKVAVLIALERLSHTNGLFLGEETAMDSGQDVIFGGWEHITFPGNGGGLAIILLLDVLLRKA